MDVRRHGCLLELGSLPWTWHLVVIVRLFRGAMRRTWSLPRDRRSNGPALFVRNVFCGCDLCDGLQMKPL